MDHLNEKLIRKSVFLGKLSQKIVLCILLLVIHAKRIQTWLYGIIYNGQISMKNAMKEITVFPEKLSRKNIFYNFVKFFKLFNFFHQFIGRVGRVDPMPKVGPKIVGPPARPETRPTGRPTQLGALLNMSNV